MLVIDEWVVLLVPVTLPAFLDIIVFLHGFALAFIISQTYEANNNNRYISDASRRNLEKLVSAGGVLGGQKQSFGGGSANIRLITLVLA